MNLVYFLFESINSSPPASTASSDIDWSKSIAEIDGQLYAKYALSAEEVEFIEKNVREME